MLQKFWLAFCAIGTIASIISVWAALTQNNFVIVISFHIFLAATFAVYLGFKCYEFGIFSKEKFQTLHNHIRWTWNDDGTSTYEVIKVIKCKAICIGSYQFKHIWSGRGRIGLAEEDNGAKLVQDGGPDIAVVYPLSCFHGEIRTIHYTLLLEDNEREQRPYIYLTARHNIGAAILEVILKGAGPAWLANVYYSDDNGNEEQAKFLKRLEFDSHLRSFRYSIFDMPKGRKIWLKWEKHQKNVDENVY